MSGVPLCLAPPGLPTTPPGLPAPPDPLWPPPGPATGPRGWLGILTPLWPPPEPAARPGGWLGILVTACPPPEPAAGPRGWLGILVPPCLPPEPAACPGAWLGILVIPWPPPELAARLGGWLGILAPPCPPPEPAAPPGGWLGILVIPWPPCLPCVPGIPCPPPEPTDRPRGWLGVSVTPAPPWPPAVAPPTFAAAPRDWLGVLAPTWPPPPTPAPPWPPADPKLGCRTSRPTPVGSSPPRPGPRAAFAICTASSDDAKLKVACSPGFGLLTETWLVTACHRPLSRSLCSHFVPPKPTEKAPASVVSTPGVDILVAAEATAPDNAAQETQAATAPRNPLTKYVAAASVLLVGSTPAKVAWSSSNNDLFRIYTALLTPPTNPAAPTRSASVHRFIRLPFYFQLLRLDRPTSPWVYAAWDAIVLTSHVVLPSRVVLPVGYQFAVLTIAIQYVGTIVAVVLTRRAASAEELTSRRCP